MGSSNYIRGRRREYRCQKLLEALGYKTMRAASSQGVFDVTAVLGGNIRFVQVKSGSAYASKVDREVLTTIARDLRGKATVEIWRFPEQCRGNPSIEVL